MNRNLYNEFANACAMRFGDVSSKFEYAKCIMKVGDVQTSREQISCALLLYLRGLDVLQNIVVDIQNWIQTYGECCKYYMNKTHNIKHNKYKQNQDKLDGFSLKYEPLLLDSIGCYDDHLKRGQAIQTLCATQCLQFDLNRVNIDEVIFQFAIHLAKKVCSDIILNINQEEKENEEKEEINNENGNNKITQSRLLFEYLLSLQSISKQDKEEIDKYLV
eukprot:258385_1